MRYNEYNGIPKSDDFHIIKGYGNAVNIPPKEIFHHEQVRNRPNS